MNILAAIDFSDVTNKVIDEAAGLASALKARLHLLHVASSQFDYLDTEARGILARQALNRARLEMKDLYRRLSEEGCQVETDIRTGFPAAAILSQVEQLPADLLVMGSHGHGALAHLLCGSVTTSVLKRCRCPVVVVPWRGVPAPTPSPSSTDTDAALDDVAATPAQAPST